MDHNLCQGNKPWYQLCGWWALSFNRGFHNNTGKDISVLTELSASVPRFHSVCNTPGIKPTLQQGYTWLYHIPPKNIGAASYLRFYGSSVLVVSFIFIFFWKHALLKPQLKTTTTKSTVETLQGESNFECGH